MAITNRGVTRQLRATLLAAPEDLPLEFADAVEAAVAAEGEAVDVAGGGSSGPNFLGQENGPSIPVPEGATGPGNATNGMGKVWTGGSGGNGLDPDLNSVRVMDPNAQNPTDYVNYGKTMQDGTWQSVNPYTGQPVPPTSPWWHIPLGK